MTEELQAKDIAPRGDEFLTKTELEKKYGKSNIRYFLDSDNEVTNTEQKQQSVLQFAKDNYGKVYTGIHSENDWSRSKWWAEGWHLVNRTGEYAVVTNWNKLSPEVTDPASMKKWGKKRYSIAQKGKARGKTITTVGGIR